MLTLVGPAQQLDRMNVVWSPPLLPSSLQLKVPLPPSPSHHSLSDQLASWVAFPVLPPSFVPSFSSVHLDRYCFPVPDPAVLTLWSLFASKNDLACPI